MLIFGHKPSTIRKDLILFLGALAALATVVTLMLVSLPTAAAYVGAGALALRVGADALGRGPIAADIDQLDNA